MHENDAQDEQQLSQKMAGIHIPIVVEVCRKARSRNLPVVAISESLHFRHQNVVLLLAWPALSQVQAWNR
jgi:hypothetical protein